VLAHVRFNVPHRGDCMIPGECEPVRSGMGGGGYRLVGVNVARVRRLVADARVGWWRENQPGDPLRAPSRRAGIGRAALPSPDIAVRQESKVQLQEFGIEHGIARMASTNASGECLRQPDRGRRRDPGIAVASRHKKEGPRAGPSFRARIWLA
jgi:hypothetical protein